MSRLDEIEERVQAATPEPWNWGGYDTDEPDLCERCDAIEVRQIDGPNGMEIAWVGRLGGDWVIKIIPDDYPLLRHARSDIPYLLAEVRRLRAALTEIALGGPMEGAQTETEFAENALAGES